MRCVCMHMHCTASSEVDACCIVHATWTARHFKGDGLSIIGSNCHVKVGVLRLNCTPLLASYVAKTLGQADTVLCFNSKRISLRCKLSS